MRGRQRVPQLVVAKCRVLLRRERYLDTRNGVSHAGLSDRVDDLGCGIVAVHCNVDRHKAPGVHLMELDCGCPLSGRQGWVQCDDHEPFLIVLFTEIDALQAAGVIHRRPLRNQLLDVMVSESDVIESLGVERARHQLRETADGHELFAAGLHFRAVHGDVRRQDRRHAGIERIGFRRDQLVKQFLDLLVHFVDAQITVFVLRKQSAAIRPGYGDNLNRSTTSRHDGRPDSRADPDSLHGKGLKDLQRASA